MDFSTLRRQNSVLYSFIGMILDLRHMSWKQLSEESGIPYDTLIKCRAGKQNTSTNRLYDIFEVIGVSDADYSAYVRFLIMADLHTATTLNDYNY